MQPEWQKVVRQIVSRPFFILCCLSLLQVTPEESNVHAGNLSGSCAGAKTNGTKPYIYHLPPTTDKPKIEIYTRYTIKHIKWLTAISPICDCLLLRVLQTLADAVS